METGERFMLQPRKSALRQAHDNACTLIEKQAETIIRLRRVVHELRRAVGVYAVAGFVVGLLFGVVVAQAWH